MAPMLDQNQIIIVASSLAGALFMLGVLGVYRCCTKRREFSYERVAHSLDEEEQAFKRTLEMQGDDIDELFGFAGEEDELRFDSAELEQIEMLERYRQNLVAASTAGAAPPPTASNPSEYRKGSSPNPSEDRTEGTTDGSYASLPGLDKEESMRLTAEYDNESSEMSHQ